MPLTKDIDGNSIPVNKDQIKNQEDKDKEQRQNPYQNQKVKLYFTIHCDDKTTLTKSEIPAPILSSLVQDKNSMDQYSLNILSIPKGFPIELHTEEHHNCNSYNLIYEKTNKIYPITWSGVDHINNFIYKDTFNLKDEDVGEYWAESTIDKNSNQIKSNSKEIKLQKKDREFFGLADSVFRKKIEVTDKDQIYSRSRIYGNFNFNNLYSRPGKNIYFEYKDDQKFNLSLEYGAMQYINESNKSNILKLSSDYFLFGNGIEEPFFVKGGDNGGGLQNYQVDKEQRRVKLTMSDLDKTQNQQWDSVNTLPNNTNIWLVSHGWDDYDSIDFREVANIVKRQYPNDLVLTVDWSQ
ncbi:MAG: hypothetical protein ACRCXZ_04390, partial [Patescibacteria group bacterium]